MSDALVRGKESVSVRVLQDVYDVLSSRVGEFDRTKSDDWQVSYMRLVAQAFSTVSRDKEGRLGCQIQQGGCELDFVDGLRVDERRGDHSFGFVTDGQTFCFGCKTRGIVNVGSERSFDDEVGNTRGGVGRFGSDGVFSQDGDRAEDERCEEVVVNAAPGLKGPNYERNRKRRIEQKQRKRGAVPAWRVGASPLGVVESKTEVSKSLEEKWILKNKLDSLKLREQVKRMELSAGQPRSPVVQPKLKTEEEMALESKARIERLERNIEKTKADTIYWKKRQETGAVEKAIALENEILDGQLSGKYDPFASRRTLGWAKTVKTHGSGTGSGSGSSGSLDKTVWSGSGATSKTDLSVLEQKVAVYEEKLKKAEKEVVDVNKKADTLNKQLITVTVESERKDKELFEVRKFKEYLEKAKKEKKRRADNEFETFRTQADCSY